MKIVLFLLLSCLSHFAAALDVALEVNTLIYKGKEYVRSGPVLLDYEGAKHPYIYPDFCPGETRVGYPDKCLQEGVFRRDQVKGLLSLTVTSSDPGLGWYGVFGLWQYATMELRSDAKLECGMRACWVVSR